MPPAGAADQDRVEPVRDRRDDDRGDAHDQHLLKIVAGRIDELRDEGAEEDERLRVADRHQKALQEEAAARRRRARRLAERARSSGAA